MVKGEKETSRVENIKKLFEKGEVLEEKKMVESKVKNISRMLEEMGGKEKIQKKTRRKGKLEMGGRQTKMEEFTHRVKMFTNLENSNNPKFCNGREDKKNKRKRQGEEGDENGQNPEEQLRKRGRVEIKISESNRNFELENENTKNYIHNMDRVIMDETNSNYSGKAKKR